MECLKKENEKELEMLKIIADFSFEQGWTTENEKLQVKTKRTLNKKKIAFFDVIKNIKCDETAAKILWAIRCINEVDPTTNSGNNKNHFLSIIISKLFEKGFVTQAEKLSFEKQLQDKDEKEDTTMENVNFSGSGLCEPQGQIVERSGLEISKNPMHLGPVIKCVLQYLNCEEIKNCRYVSKEWKSVGLNALISRSQIKFSRLKSTGDTSDRNPVTFFQVFPETPEKVIPFTTFTISGGDDTSWTVAELNYFFRIQQKYIREINFDEISLVDDCWEEFDSFDIAPWISHSPLTNPNTKFHTKLSLTASAREYNNLSIHYRDLLSIKELKLVQCQVNLEDGVRVSPIKLALVNVTFHKDGNKLTEVCDNDILDYCKVKDITLGCSEKKATKICLEMDRKVPIDLDCLSLMNITLRNWSTCRWTVNTMKLINIPFSKKTEMQIKKLRFKDIGSESRIDVAVLPQSLEELVIDEIDRRTCVCSQPVVLHNLKLLGLHFFSNRFSKIAKSVSCPNLVQLHLLNESDYQMEIDFAWIPRTVKTLRLKGVSFDYYESENLNLDTVILDGYAPFQMKMMCLDIQTKEIILNLDWEGDSTHSDSDFVNFLQYQKSFRDCGERIYVGCFDWEQHPFEESPLRNYVDMEAEYYVFENQVGKAIDENEFVKLLKVYPFEEKFVR